MRYINRRSSSSSTISWWIKFCVCDMINNCILVNSKLSMIHFLEKLKKKQYAQTDGTSSLMGVLEGGPLPIYMYTQCNKKQ